MSVVHSVSLSIVTSKHATVLHPTDADVADKLFIRYKVGHVDISTDQDFVKGLITLFQGK